MVVMVAACGSPAQGGANSAEGTTGESSSTGEQGAGSSASTGDTTIASGSESDSSTGPEVPLPCNGHVELCERPFDEVVFPGTHNSHAATDEGFPTVNANHQRGIAQQLEDGVRVLLIDTYADTLDADVVLMCHGLCVLASTPHLDGLMAITEFLNANPREVITIIYEDHVGVEEVAEDFAATGADALTFVHGAGEPWPTLGEMIDADTRLVVTAESGGPPPAWYHHVWDEAWDTPYGPSSIEDLSCDLNRGSTEHDLFLMNHWVNDGFGLPSMDSAAVANGAEVLETRALECWRRWDHAPNFVVVDFYEEGDLFAVVDALNGV